MSALSETRERMDLYRWYGPYISVWAKYIYVCSVHRPVIKKLCFKWCCFQNLFLVYSLFCVVVPNIINAMVVA
jgi:hypothetical protein